MILAAAPAATVLVCAGATLPVQLQATAVQLVQSAGQTLPLRRPPAGLLGWQLRQQQQLQQRLRP